MALVSRIDTIFVPAGDTALAAAWYMRLFGMVRIFESAGYIGLRFPDAGKDAAALTLYPAAADRDDHYRFNLFSPEPLRLHAVLTAEGVETTPLRSAGPILYFEFRDLSGNWVNICAQAGGVFTGDESAV